MLSGFALICFSEEFIKIFTTREYYPAMYIAPLYIYYYIFGILGMISIQQIQFSEKTFFILPASIVSVLCNIVFYILLIPTYGAIGAVISLSISSLFSSIVHFYYGFKLYPLPLQRIRFIAKFLCTLVFTIPIYPIMLSEINFIVKIVIKLFIITLFIITGVKFNFISKGNIIFLFKKYFHKLVIRFQN